MTVGTQTRQLKINLFQNSENTQTTAENQIPAVIGPADRPDPSGLSSERKLADNMVSDA